MVWIHVCRLQQKHARTQARTHLTQQLLLSLMLKAAVMKVTSNDVQDVTEAPKNMGPDAFRQQILPSVMLKSAMSKIILMMCRT